MKVYPIIALASVAGLVGLLFRDTLTISEAFSLNFITVCMTVALIELIWNLDDWWHDQQPFMGWRYWVKKALKIGDDKP